MKTTIKTLYDIDTKALIKYTDKVYKIESNDNQEYCLKYTNNLSNDSLIMKINSLNMDDCFLMPMKTNIRTSQAQKNNKLFYVTKWIEDDYIESYDLKLKFYLNKLGEMHSKTSYTLNVSSSYYKEIFMQIEELIEESYQKYENIIYQVERKEYKSPFEWYLIEHYKDIIMSYDKSRNHLSKFQELTKEKSVLRQVITHQNFAYDHIFLTKNKIVGNEKMNLASPVYDIKSLFDNIKFGNIDISGLFDEYFKHIQLEEYELRWLISLLFIANTIKLEQDELKNISNLMNVLFKIKSVLELESKLFKNDDVEKEKTV